MCQPQFHQRRIASRNMALSVVGEGKHKMRSPLQKWRKSKGFTQKQLATLLGISNGHWSEVENGISPIDKKIKSLLQTTGADNVIGEQVSFMETRRQELREKLGAG